MPSLKNVYCMTGNPQRLSQAVGQLEADGEAKERIICAFGPAGRGKTTAGVRLAADKPYERVYIRARQTWNVLAMLQDIGQKLGRPDMPSIGHKCYLALLERLAETGRETLIIDEANYLHARTLNVLRDAHDEAGITLILLGEQRIKEQLEQRKRLKSRVIAWVPFTPLVDSEAGLVARQLLPDGIDIQPEAVSVLLQAATGIYRDYVNLLRRSLLIADANGQKAIAPAIARLAAKEARA